MYQKMQKVTSGVSFFEKFCTKKEQRGYLCPCKYEECLLEFEILISMI